MAKGLTIPLLVAAGLMLSACNTTSNCAGWSQINPSRTDKLTGGTARQILAHNRQGVAQGCWRAPR